MYKTRRRLQLFNHCKKICHVYLFKINEYFDSLRLNHYRVGNISEYFYSINYKKKNELFKIFLY